MGSQNQYILSKKEVFFLSLLYPGIVIFICLSFHGKNFFNTFDAVDEFIGFYSEYGRIFAEGKLPLIVDRIMFGGNGVVELSHSFLNPQAVLASLLAWFCEKKQVIGIFIAYSNLFITCIAALALGRLFRFSKLNSLLFAGFVLVQPLVIVEYCRSWWNSGIGHAWGLASVTTLLYYYNNRSVRNFLLNVISIIFLMVDTWVYSIICYLLFLLLMSIHIVLKNRVGGYLNLIYIGLLIFPFSVSCFIISPLYFEYIYSSDIHNRFVGLFNNNFLAFPVSDFILSYIPTFYEFTNYFSHKMPFMSIGFSTIFIPLALFFRKNIKLFSEDSTFRLFTFYILGLFLLTQTPESIGPMRWSLRYAPFLTFFLTFITFYSLQYAESVPRQKANFYGCILFLASGFLITIFRIAGRSISLFVIEIISFVLIVSILIFKNRSTKFRNYYYIITPFLCLLLIIVGIKTTGFLNSVPYLYNPGYIELPADLNTKGFIFRGGRPVHTVPSYPYISDARGGIYNLRTISGYTPLEYKALN